MEGFVLWSNHFVINAPYEGESVFPIEHHFDFRNTWNL